MAGAPLSAAALRLYSTSRALRSETAGTVVDGEVVGSASAGASETVAGPGEKLSFQAETRQLLQIVANSLYTDKLVFVRELVSNAADALEKVRLLQVTGTDIAEASKPLEIHITTDDKANTITLADSGVGMTRDELVSNLGTIARSGSKAFVENMQKENKASAMDIIGQFGVGFYSAFMVADDIVVFSKSATDATSGYRWKSSGDGSYEIAPATSVQRGTKIQLHLKESCKEFSNAKTVEDIIMKHSNFVNFPIFLNGKQLNTVQAVWKMAKQDVTEEMYTGFYKFKSKS